MDDGAAGMTGRGCIGKIGYPDRKAAIKASMAFAVRKGEGEKARLSIYHCQACGDFHVGRNPADRPIGTFTRSRDYAIGKLRRYQELTRGDGR